MDEIVGEAHTIALTDNAIYDFENRIIKITLTKKNDDQKKMYPMSRTK